MKSLPAAGTTIAPRALLTLATAAVARPARGQAVAAVDGAHRAVDMQGVGHVSTPSRGFRRDLLPDSNAAGETMNVPQAEISNNVIKVQLYVPDLEKGFYRGTSFDWSGVIGSLKYQGHNFYGPWFTRADPTVNDFIYDGAEIVAGPCSAITGPVEEFSTDGKALGYDQAQRGGTFIKIGVGVLRKPDEGGVYSPYRLFKIVDPGSWKVQTTRDSIEFMHDLIDPRSGYGYHYEKTIRLVRGQPEMVMEHRLKNTGKRPFSTSVYNHNFLVLDGQPPGPDFILKMPFEIKAPRSPNSALAEVRGNQFVYKKALQDREVVETLFQGFSTTTADYQFTIENQKVGAGMKITGDRPLSRVALWSIRSVLSIEPFVDMTIEPTRQFSWKSRTGTTYSMAAVSNSPLPHKREPRQRVRVLAADEHADPAQLRAADTQPAAVAVRADELFVEGRHEFAAMVQEGAVGADQHIRVPQAADAGRCALGEADGDEDPVAPRRLAEECQLGPIDRDGGGGEPLEPLMRPDRRLERCPDRESRQKRHRKGDQPGAVGEIAG
jgi:hypothetical protein